MEDCCDQIKRPCTKNRQARAIPMTTTRMYPLRDLSWNFERTDTLLGLILKGSDDAENREYDAQDKSAHDAAN